MRKAAASVVPGAYKAEVWQWLTNNRLGFLHVRKNKEHDEQDNAHVGAKENINKR